MVVSITRFSSWSIWGGGRKKKKSISNALKEREMVKFPLVKEKKMKEGLPPQRKIHEDKREETRVEKEYDVVFGDWCFLSGSESDESDWSIGWSEPLGSNFHINDDEFDDGFAVLVPCYTHGCKKIEGSKNVLLNAIKNLPNEFSSAGNNYVEQWLASVQKAN